MESSICPFLYVIMGKEMNNSPNKLTGPLQHCHVGVLYQTLYTFINVSQVGEESPFIIPHYYPLQIFRHAIKAVLSPCSTSTLRGVFNSMPICFLSLSTLRIKNQTYAKVFFELI